MSSASRTPSREKDGGLGWGTMAATGVGGTAVAVWMPYGAAVGGAVSGAVKSLAVCWYNRYNKRRRKIPSPFLVSFLSFSLPCVTNSAGREQTGDTASADHPATPPATAPFPPTERIGTI